MALAINIINGRDLSNEALCELLLKKEQGNGVLTFISEHFSFKLV